MYLEEENLHHAAHSISTCEQQIAGRRRHLLLIFDLRFRVGQQGAPFLGNFQRAISLVLQFFHRSINTWFSSECNFGATATGSKCGVPTDFSFLGSRLAPKCCIPEKKKRRKTNTQIV